LAKSACAASKNNRRKKDKKTNDPVIPEEAADQRDVQKETEAIKDLQVVNAAAEMKADRRAVQRATGAIKDSRVVKLVAEMKPDLRAVMRKEAKTHPDKTGHAAIKNPEISDQEIKDAEISAGVVAKAVEEMKAGLRDRARMPTETNLAVVRVQSLKNRAVEHRGIQTLRTRPHKDLPRNSLNQ
jgi:hypothetical protein